MAVTGCGRACSEILTEQMKTVGNPGSDSADKRHGKRFGNYASQYDSCKGHSQKGSAMPTIYAALRFENIENVNTEHLHDLAMRVADKCHGQSQTTHINLRGEDYCSHIDLQNKQLGFFPRGSNPAFSLHGFHIRNQAVQNITSCGCEGLFLLALAMLMEATSGVEVLSFDTRLSQDYLDDALAIARSIDLSVRRPDWLVAPDPVIPGPVVMPIIDRGHLPAFMDFSR